MTLSPTHISLSPNPPRSEDGKYLAACGKELIGVVPRYDDEINYEIPRLCRGCGALMLNEMAKTHKAGDVRTYFTFFVRAPKGAEE